jgi:hypothetical protein
VTDSWKGPAGARQHVPMTEGVRPHQDSEVAGAASVVGTGQ